MHQLEALAKQDPDNWEIRGYIESMSKLILAEEGTKEKSRTIEERWERDWIDEISFINEPVDSIAKTQAEEERIDEEER